MRLLCRFSTALWFDAGYEHFWPADDVANTLQYGPQIILNCNVHWGENSVFRLSFFLGRKIVHFFRFIPMFPASFRTSSPCHETMEYGMHRWIMLRLQHFWRRITAVSFVLGDYTRKSFKVPATSDREILRRQSFLNSFNARVPLEVIRIPDSSFIHSRVSSFVENDQ